MEPTGRVKYNPGVLGDEELIRSFVVRQKHLDIIMLCDEMPSDHTWKLRHTLLNERRIMMIGTATSRFDTVTDPGEAWFELFAIQELKPLDHEETRRLWRSVTRDDLRSSHVRA